MKKRKTDFIIIRVTPEEKIDILKQAGKNISKYVRKILKLD